MEDGQPRIALEQFISRNELGDLKKDACTILQVFIFFKLNNCYRWVLSWNLIFLSIVDVLLKPAGDAPIMKKKKWAVDRNKRIGWVGEFIKKYLKLTAQDSVVCYITDIIQITCASIC